MPEPVWQRPTAWRHEPEMYLREPVFAMIVLEEEPGKGIPGDRYGNDPVRSSGCHGALPELYL